MLNPNETIRALRLMEEDRDRLREINAELLAALEAIVARAVKGGMRTFDVTSIAEPAIAKARGQAGRA